VARVARAMHRRHISHRDFKAVNILLAGHDVWLIDLAGIRLCQRISRKRRVQNLARLNASFFGRCYLTRSDRLRFLRVYLQWGIFGQLGWKDWWQEIDKATLAKAARNAQNGRPLA
jgi:hypothetical protein